MRAWVLLLWVASWAALVVFAEPSPEADPKPDPDPKASPDPDPGRSRRQLSAITHMLRQMQSSVSSLGRRVAPGVRYAADRLANDVAPNLSKAIVETGNNIAIKAAEGLQATAQVVSTKIMPAIEDRIVEASNAAIPYINHGIDALGTGIQKSAQMVSRGTAVSLDRIGSKVLGQKRHNRVKSITSNIQTGINKGLSNLATAITSLSYDTTGQNYNDNGYIDNFNANYNPSNFNPSNNFNDNDNFNPHKTNYNPNDNYNNDNFNPHNTNYNNNDNFNPNTYFNPSTNYNPSNNPNTNYNPSNNYNDNYNTNQAYHQTNPQYYRDYYTQDYQQDHFQDYHDYHTTPEFLTNIHDKDYRKINPTHTGVGSVGEAVGRVVSNTAYALSSRLLGQNLTQAVAPIAKSVSEAVGQSVPAVSFGDGRIVIDLPGVETERTEPPPPRDCTTPDGERGLCQDLSDCPDLILDLSNLRKSVCFKSLFVPGVCCPYTDLNGNLRPSATTRRPTTRPRPTTQRPTTPRPRPVAATTPRPAPPIRPITAPPIRPITAPPPPITLPPLPTQPPTNQPQCGVPQIPTFRVVGGQDARRGQWPWMAAVWLHGNKKTEFWCGASLVSKDYVLTAAHCTKDSRGKTFSPRQFSVRLGDHNIFSESDDFISHPQTLRVSEIKPHPDFRAHGFYNDVALLKLATPATMTQYIQPVCLPDATLAAQPLDALAGQTPSVIGWGSTFYGGNENPTLREAQLPVWRNGDCNDAYFQPITEIFLCAGFVEGGRDACQGDSGGPLLLYLGGRWVQIGLVSFGNRCAEPGYPGVYTRITHFLPWILSNMI